MSRRSREQGEQSFHESAGRRRQVGGGKLAPCQRSGGVLLTGETGEGGDKICSSVADTVVS